MKLLNTYRTNFHREATDHWHTRECVREFVQNWVDSDCNSKDYTIEDDTLVLTNRGVKVSHKMWMFGLSDKKHDNTKVGQFGTGSVMAVNVLYNRGINITIQNNEVIWKPSYKYDETFGEDVLVIEEYRAPEPDTNFTVEISGLSSVDVEEIIATTIEFQEDRKVLHETPIGRILENVDGNGEVYIGGTFVTQSHGFAYSYDFNPKELKLNQDRNAVCSWELQKLTSKMISLVEDIDFIKESLKIGKKDTEELHGFWVSRTENTDKVSEDLAKDFFEEHGNCIVTDDYKDHQEQEKLGNKSVYLPNSQVAKAIKESDLYNNMKDNLVIIQKQAPSELTREIVDEVLKLLWENDIIPVDKVYEEDEGDMTRVKHLLYQLKEESVKWRN